LGTGGAIGLDAARQCARPVAFDGSTVVTKRETELSDKHPLVEERRMNGMITLVDCRVAIMH